MPLPKPHDSAIFSLSPLNLRAEQVVAHPSNTYLTSWLDDKLVLNICYGRSTSGDKTTLATIGRNGDIIVKGSTIARVQCSFEIDLQTKIIMFYDRSHNQTCQVYGDNATPSHQTRIHPGGSQQMKIRVQKIGNRIGAGQFGEVYKAVDQDAGKLIAVKILHPPPASESRKTWTEMYQKTKREVELLSRISSVSKICTS